MDVGDIRQGFGPDFAGHADEVPIDGTLAVVALGVGGVIGEGGDGLVAVPKGDEADEGVDSAFGGVAGGGVFSAGALALEDHGAEGTEDAAVGGDIVDVGGAEADVGDGAGGGEGGAEGLGDVGDDFAVEVGVGVEAGETVGRKEALGGKVAAWGVMLMEGVDGDAVRGGASSFGEGEAEGVVAFVGNADPVEGTEDDGISGAQDDEARGGEGRDDFARGFDGAVAERRAEWGCDIGCEGGDVEGKGLGKGRGECPEEGKGSDEGGEVFHRGRV